MVALMSRNLRRSLEVGAVDVRNEGRQRLRLDELDVVVDELKTKEEEAH